MYVSSEMEVGKCFNHPLRITHKYNTDAVRCFKAIAVSCVSTINPNGFYLFLKSDSKDCVNNCFRFRSFESFREITFVVVAGDWVWYAMTRLSPSRVRV